MLRALWAQATGHPQVLPGLCECQVNQNGSDFKRVGFRDPEADATHQLASQPAEQGSARQEDTKESKDFLVWA